MEAKYRFWVLLLLVGYLLCCVLIGSYLNSKELDNELLELKKEKLVLEIKKMELELQLKTEE